jgi:hypothetical protein
LVKVQGGLVLLARGDWLRQRTEGIAANEDLLDEARSHLRSAIRQLHETRKLAAEQMHAASRRPQSAEFSSAELGSLEKRLRHQLARAFQAQARCYPDDSPDRASALAQAVELLEPLSQSSDIDPVAWQSRIDLATCYRLLKDYPTAEARLQSLIERPDIPETVQPQIRAERIHLALAQDQLPEALALSNVDDGAAQASNAELDFARLAALVAAWKADSDAGRKEDAAARQEQAAAAVEQFDQRHGAYWTRRAEALLATTLDPKSGGASANLAVAVRTAEGLYRGGRVDEALAAYDLAQSQAASRALADQAFQLGYTAATIEHARKNHRQAADRYRKLAVAMPSHAKAGEAHVLAIFNLSQAAKSEPAAAEEYGPLLEEHLRLWPQSKTAGQAKWLLGRLREHERRWEEAIAAYESVPRDHSQFAQSLNGLARAHEGRLVQLREEGRNTQGLAEDAARHFEKVLAALRPMGGQSSTDAARLAAIGAARMWLACIPPASHKAQKILEPILDQEGGAADSTAMARSLLVCWLAAQGQTDEAQKQLALIDRQHQGALQDLHRRLSQLADNSASKVARPMAELQLSVGRMLEAKTSQVADGKQQRLSRVKALVASDRPAEALAASKKLADEFLQDGQIQTAYAELLSQAEPPQLQLAAKKWSAIEARSRPGSARWFRARLSLAELHLRMGDKRRASYLVTLTQKHYPELGGAEFKKAFLVVLGRSQE